MNIRTGNPRQAACRRWRDLVQPIAQERRNDGMSYDAIAAELWLRRDAPGRLVVV